MLWIFVRKLPLLPEKSKPKKLLRTLAMSRKSLMHSWRFFTPPRIVLTQRAAGVMSYCTNAHPGLIVPHFKKMIHVLKNSPSDAVKRNTVRAWQWVPIPEAHLDDVADLCFSFLSTPQEPVAAKVFAMTVLLNITRQIPELKNELQILIEDQMPYSSAAFRSRGSKVLRALEKIVSKPDTAL